MINPPNEFIIKEHKEKTLMEIAKGRDVFTHISTIIYNGEEIKVPTWGEKDTQLINKILYAIDLYIYNNWKGEQ